MSRALWLCVSLSALSYGCKDDPRRDPPSELPPLPLAALTLPDFSCRALPRALGDCTSSAGCGSGQACVLQNASATPDRQTPTLSCSAPVGTSAARTRCERGGECESGMCALAGVCVSACGSDQDCAAGQRCAALEIRVGQAGLAPVAACARSSAFPESVTLSIEDASVTSGVLNDVDVTGGAGTSLYVLGAQCDATVQVQGLYTNPADNTLFDIDALLSGTITANPVVNLGAIVPVLVPNNPAVQASRAGYRMEVVGNADTPLSVVRATRVERGKTLDLNVFYVGGGELERAGGLHPGSAELAGVYTQLAELYEPVGIGLGDIREYDVVGALRDEFSVLETNFVTDENDNPVDIAINGLEDLFRLSAGVDDGGLNLFLVSDMGDVLGISGGIPGTLGLHGTAGSGVAVAVDVTGLAELPYVTQHELSHQMGLFHTTEIDGYAVEPLADTPICDPSFDRNGDSILSSRECRTQGGDNLMFWSSTGSGISADQIAVLRSSLILR